MARLNGSEIRPGMVIEHLGSLWVAVKTMAVKPGKGPAYNQVELKNLIDGRKLNHRFGADERVEETHLERSSCIARMRAWCSWTPTLTSRSSWLRTSWASARRSSRTA